MEFDEIVEQNHFVDARRHSASALTQPLTQQRSPDIITAGRRRAEASELVKKFAPRCKGGHSSFKNANGSCRGNRTVEESWFTSGSAAVATLSLSHGEAQKSSRR
jgi:hypothetical protein